MGWQIACFFFQQRNYHCVYSDGDNFFNDFMGPFTAFPNSEFKLLDSKIQQVSDTRSWPKPPALSLYARINIFLWSFLTTFFTYLPFSNKIPYVYQNFLKKKDVDPFTYSQYRKNVTLSVKLLPKKVVRSAFWVGNYHMPCAFWSQKVMVIHTSLVFQNFQKLISNEPGVLSGDWNFKPTDTSYLLATTGYIDPKSRDYPSRPFDDWKPNLAYGMKSAYFEKNGKEPMFTNYAFSENEKEAFVGTLDFIFITGQFRVVDVIPLPNSTFAFPGPLPVARESSDHLLLGATLAY